MHLRYFFCLFPVLVATFTITAAESLSPGETAVLKQLGRELPVIRLWPNGSGPGETRPATTVETVSDTARKKLEGATYIRDVTAPSLTIVSPKEKTDKAPVVLICPGGGYALLGMHWPLEFAAYLNERGIHAALLKYRVPKRRAEALQDIQRAMGILRGRAAEWGIDPNKIVVNGYSAGGHLAARLCNNYDKRDYTAVDDFDKVSAKPNAAILNYPAYLTKPIGSRTLAGELMVKKRSKANTPPTFMTVTMPDQFLPGSVSYFQELATAKVPAELHVYPTGPHGSGMDSYPYGQWAGEAYRFLQDMGLAAGGEAPPKDPAATATREPEADSPYTPADQHLRSILGDGVETLYLWPEGRRADDPLKDVAEKVDIKGILRIGNVTRPSLTVRRPSSAKSNGRAVIICPGGGYGILAAEHEGTMVADWLNDMGITAVLLKYRCPRRKGLDKHHVAFQDGQRAIRLVRANAKKWKIDPDKIGVLGFSAGGHLTAMLATNGGTKSYEPIDSADRLSAVPDFSMPIYPAYLDAKNPPMNLDKDIAAGLEAGTTGPLFMAIAANDHRFVPGTLNFLMALRATKVPTELHVYHSGGHGGGIFRARHPFAQWIPAGERWLKDLETGN